MPFKAFYGYPPPKLLSYVPTTLANEALNQLMKEMGKYETYGIMPIRRGLRERIYGRGLGILAPSTLLIERYGGVP